ncbi:hypothetical protein FHT43_002666 [Mycolicibacterium sp. BK607]|nr:hypothetical protein [Mycolicibacterium sp. BK607]
MPDDKGEDKIAEVFTADFRGAWLGSAAELKNAEVKPQI